LKTIDDYKIVLREIYHKQGRQESDAEHSWHVAMFCFLFEKELPKEIDRIKLYKLALMHDIVEIYSGDPWFALNDTEKAEKRQKEQEAAKQLFAQLPSDLEKEFHDLFHEYEQGTTPEAKMIKGFDKLQPILTNIAAGGISWQKNKVTKELLYKHKWDKVKEDELLKRIYELLIEEAETKKLFYKDSQMI